MSKLYEQVNNGTFGQVELRACQMISQGRVVIDLSLGVVGRQRNLRTIEIGENMHVDHPDGGFVNHHCAPTCFVNKEKGTLDACRDIEVGESITFDYMVSESDIHASFQCQCGAATCRGYIGYPHSTPSFLEPSGQVTPSRANNPSADSGKQTELDRSPDSVTVPAEFNE